MFNIVKHFINFNVLYYYIRFKLKFRVKKNPELFHRFIKVGKFYPKTFCFYCNYVLTESFVRVKMLKFEFFLNRI